MRISRQALLLSMAPGALAALASCTDAVAPAADAVTGVVVDTSGSPRPGARVVLDALGGRTALTDERGAFSLGEVTPGQHVLHVLHNEAREAATLPFEMPQGGLALEPVRLAACDGPAALEPCTWLEGRPVLSRRLFDALALDNHFGQVQSDNLAVSGERIDGTLFLKFAIAGDFAQGGTLRLEDPDPNEVASLLSLTDQAGVHFYALRGGTLDVLVERSGDGHVYEVTGRGLVFLYQDWSGDTDPTYTVEIGSLTLAGQAQPPFQADAPF
jgi:hypothetical protein